MASRLYYATTYKADFDGGYFNHKHKFINELLVNECNANYYGSTPESAERLEVDRREIDNLILDFETNPIKYERLMAFEGVNYEVEDLIEIFKEIRDYSEKSIDMIILEWW